MAAGRPLQLILARNLISHLARPAVLVDGEGALVFYNLEAGALVGQRFEETGRLELEEWTRAFAPLDEDGHPLSATELPFSDRVQDGRPAQGRFGIRAATGANLLIDVTVMPLVGLDGFQGAILLFVRAEDAG